MEWYIGKEWQMPRKGLRKIVLALDFTKLEKPTEVSKVLIKIHEIQNLNERASKLLKTTGVHEWEMGTALTAIDCYVELLIQQMILGEKANCFIKPKNGNEINFIMTLERILEAKQIHTLSVKEMFERAQRFKENGVKMFKEFPAFAHNYFVRAAKCLISYKPFDNLSAQNDGVDGADMQTLLTNIQTNLAACLLAEQKYQEVIYQTEFVEKSTSVDSPHFEKAVYRRATAYFHMRDYEKAQKVIESFPNYQENKAFFKLQQRIAVSMKVYNEELKNVAQRMFS